MPATMRFDMHSFDEVTGGTRMFALPRIQIINWQTQWKTQQKNTENTFKMAFRTFVSYVLRIHLLITVVSISSLAAMSPAVPATISFPRISWPFAGARETFFSLPLMCYCCCCHFTASPIKNSDNWSTANVHRKTCLCQIHYQIPIAYVFIVIWYDRWDGGERRPLRGRMASSIHDDASSFSYTFLPGTDDDDALHN